MAPQPPRTWWVLTPDMERTIRFLVGIIIIVHQTVLATTPETLLLGTGLVLAGSPLANMADDRFRRGRNGDGDG